MRPRSRDYPIDVKAWRNLSPDMRYARAETMLAFLELLRERVGGWEEYVVSFGVPKDAVASMRCDATSMSQDGRKPMSPAEEIDPSRRCAASSSRVR